MKEADLGVIITNRGKSRMLRVSELFKGRSLSEANLPACDPGAAIW